MANTGNTFMRSNSVTVDDANVALRAATTLGRGPVSDVAVDGDVVLIANFGDNSLTVLEGESLSVTGGVKVGQPFAVAASDGRAFVAVSSASDDAVTVVDTATGDVVAAYPMAGAVTALIVTPDGKRAFVARDTRDGADIAVIDVPAQRVASIPVAHGADITIDALRVDAAGRRLFVATSDSVGSRVLVFDVATGRLRRTLELGAPIRGLELGLDSTAYVLTSDLSERGVLHVVDLVANRIVAAVPVGTVPTQLALGADGTRAFVVDYDRVHIVCTETRAVVGSISVGGRPACVASVPGRLYVADYSGALTSYEVVAPAPALYPPFVATALAAPVARELAPAGA